MLKIRKSKIFMLYKNAHDFSKRRSQAMSYIL